MTRVNINGAGHQVEVDHESADLTYVVEKAQKLWQDTRPAEKTPGPAYGFSAEREHRRNGYAYMGDGDQPAVK